MLKDQFNGRNLITTSFIHGLDGTYKDFIDNDALPKQHFNKIILHYIRDQQIIDNFSAYAHITASHSKDILPDAQQSTIGGREFGRGYGFSTLEATKMTAGSLELRYTKNMDNYINQLQPYIFADSAHANRVNPNTSVSHLESFGAGLRARFIKNTDLGIEVAQPCQKHFTVNGSDIKAKTNFTIFINKLFEF